MVLLTKKLLVRCRSRDAVENPDANDDVDMPLSKPDTPDGSSDDSKESVGMSDINPAYKSAFLMRVTRVPIRAMASAAQ